MQSDDVGLSWDFPRRKGTDRCLTWKEEERGTNHPAIGAFLSCLKEGEGSGANLQAPVVNISCSRTVPKGVVGDSIVELGTGEFVSELEKKGGGKGEQGTATSADNFIRSLFPGLWVRGYGNVSLGLAALGWRGDITTLSGWHSACPVWARGRAYLARQAYKRCLNNHDARVTVPERGEEGGRMKTLGCGVGVISGDIQN